MSKINLLLLAILQQLKHTDNELCLDTQHIFGLMMKDSEFAGLISTLRNQHSTVISSIPKAMQILHTSQLTDENGRRQELSPTGCLVVSLIEQWLIRHLCKQLMQLMTSEAIILYRKLLPSSYITNYLKYQSHFSLKHLIKEHFDALEATDW